MTSTPDGSLEVLSHDSDISIIPTQTECPILVSDSSTQEPEVILEKCDSHQQLCSRTCDVHDQTTIRLETPDQSQISNYQNHSTQTKQKQQNSLEELARNILKNSETNEICDCKLDSSKQNANKSETSKQKRNKSTTSENQTILDEYKTTVDNFHKKSADTSNADAAPKYTNTKKSLKKCVQIQLPNRVNKTDFCDLSDEEIHDSSKECLRVPKHEGDDESLNVEQLSVDEDGDLKLKPCPCTSLECIHKDETGSQLNDDFKTDGATSVNMDSGGGSSCAGACEHYYRNKLMATLQILENKEETIRVQGSSLGVAEARIAALTDRACALRCELDHKARELNKLRKFAENCRVEKTDVSITAEMQEVEIQKRIVNTLEDNLSVIAELYRECFYETAKQEELIELLRKSYLDVRLMEKDKTDKINRLQNVVNTQKWSIEQCQDVVIEVENLKSEISSFLNSSNNDSGMWERGSESPDVGEELGDILDQLRQLQDMLTGDCTCGLEDENKALKKKNENLEMQVDKLRHRVTELESTVSSSHSLGQEHQKLIEEKEREFHEVRRQLVQFESANKEREATCESLTRQLQQAQVLLEDKMAELAEAQCARAAQEAAVRALRAELDQADAVIKEGLRKLVEASQWRAQLEASQARATDLQQQLEKVCARCRDLETCCREKERSASALQCQLEEAHARGAALCDESRRVTGCVRHWMRRQKTLAREQQEKIKMQESMLCELQRCVEARRNHSVRTSPSETEPCCSKSLPRLHSCGSETTSYPPCSRSHRAASESEPAFSRCGLPLPRSVDRESEIASCSKCASNIQDRREHLSESEMGSCASVPVPPRRRKKLPPCGDIRCPWPPEPRFASLPRELSPTEEVLERVEQLHAALAAGQRRWARARR